MCAICGCSGEHGHEHEHEHEHEHGHEHGHEHEHEHEHGHEHEHERATAGTIRLERAILEKNDRLAAFNRGWLAGRDILAVNLMSSPGAGKTTLLERTIRELGEQTSVHVVEGDQATDRDAERIRKTGAGVVQINTGTGCHLDAAMVARALRELDPPRRSVVMIENVGNLVCPALFDLGERARVVIASVTEGDDKPIKYPYMFRAGEVLILNKIDLLPYVAFDVGQFLAHAREVNPTMRVFQVSATRGDGIAEWCGWIRDQRAQPGAPTK